MPSLDFRVSELERILENLIKVGSIAELDEASARVRVRYATDDNGKPVLTAPLPWFTRRAGGDRDWWAPEVGEQVMILSPCGILSQGVVLPAIYQDASPAPADSKDKKRLEFQDGGFVEYDRSSGQLSVSAVGDAQINVGGQADIVVEDKATLTGKGTIELIGSDGGVVKGSVQGDCLCAFTGKPHPHISATVKETP